jgi:uncharacterized protein involved in exopolysaccharide biosynthesis
MSSRGHVSVSGRLAPLRRQWPLILTFSLSAALSSLALTYVMSEKYLASAIVVLQPNEDLATQPKSRNALGFPLPLVPLESIANTLEDILKGEAVLEKTVRELRLDIAKERKPTNRAMTFVLDFKDWLKEKRTEAWQILKYGRVLPKDNFRGAMINLQKNLSIKRTNKAYTVRLEALDEDPERAAQIVNTAGAKLAETVTESRAQVNREARKNIEARLAKAGEMLDTLRARVDMYKRRAGVSELSQEVSLRLKSLSDLEDDLARTRANIDAAVARRARVEEQLKESAPSVTYTATTSDNPLYNELRSEKTKLEVELSGLLETVTPEHDNVKAVRAKLKEATDRLAQEKPKLLTSESTRLNEIHTKLESDLLEVDVELRTQRAREAVLRKTFEERGSQARRLVESEPELESLMMRLQTEEKSYQLISEAYQEALLAESKSVPEVIIQREALVPSEPARPIKILHVATSLLLGLAIGIGMAFGFAFLERRVTTPIEAELAVELPVIGIMPEMAAGVELARNDAN